MDSRSRIRDLLIGLALTAAGAAITGAWRHALWGSVAGAVLVVGWLLGLLWLSRPSAFMERSAHRTQADGEEMAPLRLLLDQMPTPLVGIEGESARALNRAARALFAAQDRIVPVPPAMLAPTMARMIHAGRHWRIDRVEAGGTVGARTILALIDIEAEERSGEARAAAEMIHVMGHELLNGLAPIVSLAESGLAAWGQDEARRAQLMPEILATLARRAESLQRFTEAYRALARLPDPALADMVATAFLGDMALLFAGHWQGRVALRMQPPPVSTSFRGDRDQLTQAVWALLQNAAEAALAGTQTPWVEVKLTLTHGQVAIQVSDSGEGIPFEHRARIFHPFHTTKEQGTGIGLSLSRQIARAHGGELQLESGGATSFKLSLPGGTEHG